MTNETPTIPSIADPGVLADPFPVYDLLRREAPVFRSPELGMVLVTRYDDIMMILRDPETFSNRWFGGRAEGSPRSDAVAAVLREGYPPAEVMNTSDGDAHEFQTGLIKPFLTASKVRAMAPTIQGIVDELVDRLRVGEVTDLVSDFAEELAINVLCEFTGFSREHRELFALGADAEVTLLGAVLDDEQALAYAKTFVRFQTLIADELRDRATSPRDDLVTRVATATPPGDLEPLTMTERVRIMIQLVSAGNETTRALITSAVKRLCEDPELLARVRDDDDALDRLIEETLRADSPVLALFRVATKDVVVRGFEIKQGEMLAVVFGAANHDAEVFGCPHAFDPDRENLRKHLAFGFGTHFCLGAPLARLEARIAIRTLVDRFGTLRLAPGPVPPYLGAFVVHNLSSLPVILGT